MDAREHFAGQRAGFVRLAAAVRGLIERVDQQVLAPLQTGLTRGLGLPFDVVQAYFQRFARSPGDRAFRGRQVRQGFPDVEPTL